MKFIFLDIDGVLNSKKYDMERAGKQGNIDESRVILLKDIVNKSGAKIVLSSTWRKHWDKNPTLCDEKGLQILETFSKYDLKIFDKTPLGYKYRPLEIAAWLLQNKNICDGFVILDDTFGGWNALSDYHVKTDLSIGRGLEAHHVEKALVILDNLSVSESLYDKIEKMLNN